MADVPSGLPNNLPPHLQQLFNVGNLPFQKIRGANQYGPNLRPVGKGSLVKFNYIGIPGKSVIHDSHPVIIIYSMRDDLIKGVNIRYLTFPYIRTLLGANNTLPMWGASGNPTGNINCDNPNISYNNIKGDKYITDAFRSYKRAGIKQLRKLDCGFLLKVLGEMRSFNPNEVEQMRTYVRDALRNLNQSKPRVGARDYSNWMTTNRPNYKTGIAAQPTPPPNVIGNE